MTNQIVSTGKAFSKLSLYKRPMCIFVVVILCGIFSFLRNYSTSTNMSGLKTDLYPQISYEKRQKYDEKRSGCNNSLLAADPLRSSIYNEAGRDTIHLGDYVSFKVVLFNGYGKPVVTGGDLLRARLYNDSIGAFMSGTIFDHENGTYTLIFQALWTGWTRLEVELLYTKEVIATSIRLRKTWDFSDIMAKFSYNDRLEITKCSPEYKTAASYSRESSLCNFSYWNKSMPWYCVMPKHNMSCKNWMSIFRNWKHYTDGINKCEENLSVKRNNTRIPSNISVRILQNSYEGHNNVAIAESGIPCSSYNFTKLWFMETPTGYFYKDKWNLIHCKGNTRFIGECFRNKTVLFWGDSTLLQWFQYIKSQLAAKSRFVCTVLMNAEHLWQQTVTCFYHKYNLTLYSMGHNIPVSTPYRNNLYNLLKENLFEKVIKTRKSDDFLLVIHLYAHLQQYNLHFFANHFYEIKRSLKRIFKLDTKIKVFIKLPHTYRRYKDKKWMIRQSDYVGFIYTDILREIFKGLYNRVIVLDQKDATIARRNTRLHPSKLIVEGMVHQLMSYVCKSN